MAWGGGLAVGGGVGAEKGNNENAQKGNFVTKKLSWVKYAGGSGAKNPHKGRASRAHTGFVLFHLNLTIYFSVAI